MSTMAWRSPSGHLATGPDSTEHLSFETHSFTGELVLGARIQGMEVGVVLLAGQVQVQRGPASFTLGPRSDLFDELPDSAYLPPEGQLVLSARDPARVAIAWARGAKEQVPRRIAPADVVCEERGKGVTARSIRHILRVSDPVASLLLVEVITPPSHWSSFPPHRHDRHLPPEQTLLEETYLFHVRPAEHVGLMGVWEDAGGHEGYLVHDGDLVVVKRGYHTVSAPPGARLYYLNAMAGPVHAWKPVFHPAYLHLVEGWEGAPTGGA